jgi:hypothetical protein
MSFANAIRILLVTGWLALFGSHALRDGHGGAAVASADPARRSTDLLVGDQGGSAEQELGRGTPSGRRDGQRSRLTTGLRARLDGLADPATPLRPGSP